jgi:hypothetical protein
MPPPIQRVVNKWKHLESKGSTNTSISTAGKNRPKPSLKSIAENFEEKVIRVTIYNFAVIEGERLTVKKLFAKLVHDISFSCNLSSFGVCLKEIYFIMRSEALVAAAQLGTSQLWSRLWRGSRLKRLKLPLR